MYTAIEKMRKINKAKFGKDIGPFQPSVYSNRRCKNDLKSAALRFIHNSCEGLRFDETKEREESELGHYLGTSLKPNQIPYNMQMDINRLCLEKSLEDFIGSGTAEDAYSVYFCYLEIFFGRYGRSKKMIELLSEFESNGSSLLMKHRDHYVHSVYVFALGLAIYETNNCFRDEFAKFYNLEPNTSNTANLFLEFWGMTALFHDIGYPFELPFEQVLSYFEVDQQERGKGSLYLAYHSIEALTDMTDEAKKRFESLYHRTFNSISELLTFDITRKLGDVYRFDEAYLQDVIDRKPIQPNDFGYFMDHAYFSAMRLYREMTDILGTDKITEIHIDSLSAILLHNSLYKFNIAFYKDKKVEKRRGPLPMHLHPLAWMLMMCDELQCWDRTAYGRNSRRELHPVAASFDFSNQGISGIYYYDEYESDKIESYLHAYEAWKADPCTPEPRLKAYSDMAGESQKFTEDIKKIVDTSGCQLQVTPDVGKIDRKNKHVYLSSSNFLHLYDFAVALHGRNKPEGTPMKVMEEQFKALSLEYQLSTLNRAKYFARYLHAIRCFYTDKPVDYSPVLAFGPKDASIFAPMEHERWIREHQAMGWHFGKEYEKLALNVSKEEESAARKALREQTRTHKLAMDGRLTSDLIFEHYRNLPVSEQNKDWKPFNTLLKLLKQFDGLRIYRLD